MSAEQRLYNTLRDPAVIPPLVAAEYFVNVKLASGGLLATEVDLLAKLAEGSVSQDDIQDALSKGTLQGIRSSVAHRLQYGEKLRETKGERWGKGLGTAAGAMTGLLAGQGTAADRAVRAGVGALAGHALGKATGQAVDAHRVSKAATIEKESAINPAALMRLREAIQAVDLDSLRDTAISGGVQGGADGALEDTLSTAGSMAGSAVPGRFKIPAILAGHFAGKGAARIASKDKEASLRRSIRKIAQLDSPTAVGTSEPMQDAYPVEQAPAPQRDETGDPMPATPVLQPDQDLMPNPLDGILDLLQKGNEAEHYQQKAEDAEQVAQRAQEAAELAQGQLEAVQKEQEIAMQQHAEELHAARTEAAAAAGETQAVHQQIMSSQAQVQEAQAQAASLLQGMNQFRQGLIDYLAQDPSLAATPGLMAPTPGSGQILEDPTQAGGMPGDPAAAGPGMPAGPETGAPPASGEKPAEGGGEGGGGGSESAAKEKSEGSEKKEESSEKKEKSESKDGDKKGVTVHVH